MKTRSPRSYRVFACFLALLQILTIFQISVSAAGAAGSTGRVSRWTERARDSDVCKNNGTADGHYTLNDAENGSIIGNSEWSGIVIQVYNRILTSLALPQGLDPKDSASYYLKITGKRAADQDGYSFSKISPNKQNRNYYQFQPTDIHYTTMASSIKGMATAPAGTPLSDRMWFVIPEKAAEYDSKKASTGDKNDESTFNRDSYYTDAEVQEIKALYETYLQKYQKLNGLREYILSQDTLQIGGYHPQLASKLKIYNCYVGVSQTPSINQFVWGMKALGFDIPQMKEYVNTVLDQAYDYVESTRIDSPDITSFEVSGSKARIDAQKHTVTLNLPADAKLDSEPIIETNGYTYAVKKSGSLSSNRMTYTVTPYCPVTGILYNEQRENITDAQGTLIGGTYSNLSQEWTVIINHGQAPFNDVTSFSFYDSAYKKTRYAVIQNPETAGAQGSISLNMPVETNLSVLVPQIKHLGQYVEILNGDTWTRIEDGKAYDFSMPRKIRVRNDSFGGLTTEYLVTITAVQSKECQMLGFKIGHEEAQINQVTGKVTIRVPYATLLDQVTADIETSEFASVTVKPAKLEYNTELTYVVTAQDGSTKREYKVTISRVPAATGKAILQFSYGSVLGEIGNGVIRMKVSYGADLSKLTPTIVTSEFATVYPASGQAVDFTNSEKTPVKYTVTAQNGDTATYLVTITKADKPESTPYGDILEKARDNIITLYEKTYSDGEDKDGRCGYDDWELMNLGFAKCTQPVEKGDPLPFGLNIYDHIAAINPSKMTDYARVIMMLTALGINASRLDDYGDGTPFKDGDGKTVTNLVKELYSFKGNYTINGPIFALIALDMGNYTVPSDAKWTREKLLQEVLNHKYGSDGWGIDMVAMLMQCLYPYMADIKYGEQVRAKQQEGYNIILGYEVAPSVDPMGSDYSFFSWGTVNSECTAQVICALCTMGVDVGTDPSFSNYQTGDYKTDSGVIPAWLNRFLVKKPDGSVGTGFGHASNGFDKMGTYQSMYATQWYLNFYKNGGGPYSLYADRFDFSRQLSTACEMLSFTLEGQTAQKNGVYFTVNVPDGMPLEKLTPVVEVSEGAQLIAPAFPVTFVEGTPTAFTVQAEDGSSRQTYYVTPKYDASVKGKGTTLFTDTIQIQNEDMADKDMEDMQITKNEDGTTDILITIVPGVDTTKLRFKADISYKATASIDVTGKSNVDLHDWTEVIVTAEDGVTKQTYRIKVVSQTFASITEFAIKVDGVEYGAVITATGATGTIRFVGIPDTADLTRVVPTTLKLGEGTTEVLPSASAPQNFAEGAEYTVKGEGLRTRTYSVVTSSKGGGGDDDDSKPVNNSFAITSFKIGDKAAEIDNTNGIIKITLPYGTNLYQVAPKIETGSGCVVSPRSGQVVNLSVPATYTLTRGEEKRTYTVIVTLQKSASQLIWDKAAIKMNPSSYQTSPDLGKKDPEPTYIPSTSQILSGMKVQVNGKDIVYQATGSSNWLLMTPDSYSAANTYRFRAEKGALKNIAANGYNGFGVQAGKLMIGITEKMDTARGLDLSLCPVPSAAQTAWKNKSGVVGVWKITCDSVSGGLTLMFDCSGQTGKLALAKYNEAKKCFEQVSEKKWSVSGSILTASNMSAGIYGVIKIG